MSGVINGDGSPLPGSYMGLPTTGWYASGLGGSEKFTPRGVGATAEGPQLAQVVVTVPGASSVPAQPVASVGTWDASTQSQGELYSGPRAGSEQLSGVDYVGTTGIERPGSYGHAHGVGP